MFYHDLDDLPCDVLPDHLVVISANDFQQAKRTRESGQFLLDADKHFLVMPTVEEAKNHPVIRPIYEANHLKENTVLLKSLQDGKSNYYLPYEMVTEQSIETQMLHFPALCQHLGAKSVKITMSEETKELLEANASIKATIKGAKVGTGVNYENNNNTNKSTEWVLEFEGGHVDLQEAEILMNTDIFRKNKHIVAFYNTAKNINNRIKTQKAKISMDEQASKQLSAFLNANIPMLKTIFNADMRAKVEKYQALEIEFEVTF